MSKLKLLFVLFSLVVVAGSAGAQEREHERDRGDANRQEHDRGDRSVEQDNEDHGNSIENDRGRNGDDNENDDGNRGGIGRNGCRDSNGNNVCDIVGRSVPTSLPEMINAVLISRGQLTPTGRSWLGGGSFIPRFQRSANGTPRQVTWLDSKKRVSQVWLDTNHDGRADVVRFYRGGKLVRTVRR